MRVVWRFHCRSTRFCKSNISCRVQRGDAGAWLAARCWRVGRGDGPAPRLSRCRERDRAGSRVARPRRGICHDGKLVAERNAVPWRCRRYRLAGVERHDRVRWSARSVHGRGRGGQHDGRDTGVVDRKGQQCAVRGGYRRSAATWCAGGTGSARRPSAAGCSIARHIVCQPIGWAGHHRTGDHRTERTAARGESRALRRQGRAFSQDNSRPLGLAWDRSGFSAKGRCCRH